MKITTILILSFIVTIKSVAWSSGIHVTDDRQIPVKSIIFIDGRPHYETDDDGKYIFSETPCPLGTIISAEPIEHKAEYILPSSKCYCLKGEFNKNIILTRKRVKTNVRNWYNDAVIRQDWAVAARAANENYGLIRMSDPEAAEQAKYETLKASALAINLDPNEVIDFDSSQQTHVMKPAFAEAVKKIKQSKGIVKNSKRIDNDFFKSITKVTTANLRYNRPNI